MNNWKTLKEETPIECSICLITVNGNVALATYSEGEFIQYGNDERHYNNVSAWQYTDPPYNNAKSELETAVEYLRNKFQSCREYSNEDEKFYLLGGYNCDRVFVVRPRRIEDIECINTFNKCITGGVSTLDYRNIGETYVLIFKAVGFSFDLEEYEYLIIKTASEVIKSNTQEIMDIITIMSRKEIETEGKLI